MYRASVLKLIRDCVPVTDDVRQTIILPMCGVIDADVTLSDAGFILGDTIVLRRNTDYLEPYLEIDDTPITSFTCSCILHLGGRTFATIKNGSMIECMFTIRDGVRYHNVRDMNLVPLRCDGSILYLRRSGLHDGIITIDLAAACPQLRYAGPDSDPTRGRTWPPGFHIL